MGAAPKLKSHFEQPLAKPSFGRWVGIILLLLAGLVLLFSFAAPNPPQQTKAQKIFKSEEYNKDVNEHLKLTAQKIQMQQQASQIESAKTEISRPGPNDTELSPIRNTDLLDLNPADETGVSLTETLQEELYQQQKLKESNEFYKKEYARQFVENAKKHGYAIELSSDYRVLSVKKINKKDTPNLFEDAPDSN